MAPYWVSAFGQISYPSLPPQATGSKLIRNLLSLLGRVYRWKKKMIRAKLVWICDQNRSQQVGQVKAFEPRSWWVTAGLWMISAYSVKINNYVFSLCARPCLFKVLSLEVPLGISKLNYGKQWLDLCLCGSGKENQEQTKMQKQIPSLQLSGFNNVASCWLPQWGKSHVSSPQTHWNNAK